MEHLMAHGDFYFAINATFYHFTERWGPESLIRYWRGSAATIWRHWGRSWLKKGRRRWRSTGATTLPVSLADK